MSSRFTLHVSMAFTAPLTLLLLSGLVYFVWLARPSAGGSRRSAVSLGLRLLIVTLLVLALAGAQTVHTADELAVVFLIDASDSISATQTAQAEEWVRAAIEGMGVNDQAAVVVFGANALVERPMSRLAELAPITSIPQTWQTDLAEAIRLGLALFPAGSARRLVILSDGLATTGDALAAARLAAASGVVIDVLPLSRPPGAAEAWLTEVDAPTRVSQGEGFRLTVTAESNRNTAATLRVLAGGAVVYEQAVNLRPGVNNFSLGLRASEQEFARYVVELAPVADTYYQNNRLAAFTEVSGPPRVLLVSRGEATGNESSLPSEPSLPASPVQESTALRLGLEAAGLLVETAAPAQLPAALPQLSPYASVALVNVNAKDLTTRQMTTLQSYVRDLGGGLLTIGGPESYGMGGYYHTPLEETLPVDMQIKDQERFPAVSMVIVIDRSGSMSAQEEGVTKIQLAAEGAVRVVELLHDFDEITVIPVDTQPDNPIGPLPASQREEAISRIRRIGAGGGGIYVRAGLEAAAEALAQSSNQIKHVILLADGADSEQKEGVPELIEALAAEGVTVSVVSIGNGPDVPWLQQMAALGGGRFHFTDRAANLPQIFTQETTAIQRSYLVEERFFPSQAAGSPILAGLTAVPPLYGYVGASGKEAAQVILQTHLGDPLLAAWQYGLGRAVAWTSDATGRWAADWVRWPGFPVFWAQAVRWTIGQGRSSSVETVVSLNGERATLLVNAQDSQGTPLSGLALSANVVSPAGQVTSLELSQVAPGRYEGNFSPSQEGAYLMRVTGTAGGESGPAVGQTTGWVLGYSPEYRRLAADPQYLAGLAAVTSGQTLALDGPASVFQHNLTNPPARRPVWTWLTLVAILLLPLDVALRRLAFTGRDAQKVWARLFGRAAGRPLAAVRSEPVGRLFQAKQRAAGQAGGQGGGGAGGQGADVAQAAGLPTTGRGETEPSPPTPLPEGEGLGAGGRWQAAGKSDEPGEADVMEQFARTQPAANDIPPIPNPKSKIPNPQDLAARLLEKKRR